MPPLQTSASLTTAAPPPHHNHHLHNHHSTSSPIPVYRHRSPRNPTATFLCRLPQAAANVDQKASARLSRPYVGYSPLLEAVRYSPLVSTSELNSSGPITLRVPSTSQQQTPSSTGSPPPSLPSLSPPGALNFPPIAALGMSSPSHQPASPTSSIPSGDGGQHTPTFHQRETDGVPDRHILEWDIEDVASYVASIGLEQYRDSFLGW